MLPTGVRDPAPLALSRRSEQSDVESQHSEGKNRSDYFPLLILAILTVVSGRAWELASNFPVVCHRKTGGNRAEKPRHN